MKKIFILLFSATLTMQLSAQQPMQKKNHTQHIRNDKETTPENRAQRKADLLKSQLGLTPEQTQKITTAMIARNNALKELRTKHGENHDAMRAEAMPIRKKFQADIQTILTPDQFKKFKEMRNANRRPNPNAKPPKEGDDLIDESELDLQKQK